MTSSFTCDAFERVLGDLLEQDADESIRMAAEAHAMQCPACGALLDDLRRLRTDAARLSALEPERDLWTGMADRLVTPVIAIGERGDEAGRDVGSLRGRSSAGRRSWAIGVAVAASLVIATAGVTTFVVRRSVEAGAPVASRSDVAPLNDAPIVLASNTRDEQAYDHEIAGLREMVAKRRASMDPLTIAVVERNLAVIDSAIAECKDALARDPNSQFLVESLSSAYESKIALLRTAAALPGAE